MIFDIHLIQEHAVSFVFRLLSPPASAESRANSHYLVSYAPMLHATLLSISSNDVFNILSLYGMVSIFIFHFLIIVLLILMNIF